MRIDPYNVVANVLSIHLESMYLRMKLKGIDKAPHKWWSMWFNSNATQRTLPRLDMPQIFLKEKSALKWW